jgi:hypothetical protein
MTVRILVFIVVSIVVLELAFGGNLTSSAVTDQIGIQAIRSVFEAI